MTTVAPRRPNGVPSIESQGRDVRGLAFQGTLLLTLLLTLAILVVLILYSLDTAWPVLTERPGDFVTANLSNEPGMAGVAQGIRGSVLIAVITAILAFPLGIMTAVYLEEYASDNLFTRIITLNVRNLAGVPSVVFGLLGLNLFVKALGNDLDPNSFLGRAGRAFLWLVAALAVVSALAALAATIRTLRRRPTAARAVGSVVTFLAFAAAAALVVGYALEARRDYGDGGLTGGRTVVAAGVTISALVLPIVIITTMEALRAVPRSIREAGYGVGASRWEVTKDLVLPAAAPGILTGSVLSLSRAVGEAAPILLVGAITLFYSDAGAGFFESLRGAFTALPAIIFGWARLPGEDYQAITSAAIIAILVLTFALNAVAIALRNRFDRSW